MDPSKDMTMLEELAADLGMPLDEDTANQITKYVSELENRFDEFDDTVPQGESTGQMSTDEYNALLEIYDTPRTATDPTSSLLNGITLAIKDNIAVKNLTMTCGSKTMDFVPPFDAIVAERLLDAGGQIIGKANMDKFAVGPGGEWSDFDQPINPVAPNRVPGGSSSGSGVAVAAGLVDAALGSDTGGSVRTPAGFTGIVGMRPTHRLVPRYGFVENKQSFDTIGPLARDVETTAKVLKVIAGPDPRDPSASHVQIDGIATELEEYHDLTFGVVENVIELAEEPITDQINSLVETLREESPVTVTTTTLELDNVDFAYSLIGTENTWRIRESFVTRGHGVQYNPALQSALADASFSKHIAHRMLPGALLDKKTDGKSYILARQKAIEFSKKLSTLFEEVDILLTPTHRILPPELGVLQSSEDNIKYTFTKPFSLYNGPVITVPAGTQDGLPVSAQLAGERFNDDVVLQAAKAVEDALSGATP